MKNLAIVAPTILSLLTIAFAPKANAVPQIYAGPNGIEVTTGDCYARFDNKGNLLQGGSMCDDVELFQAKQAAATYVREQPQFPENPYKVGDYYNATAYFRCSVGNADHDKQCPGGIVRQGNGNASVVVKYPNGYEVQYDFSEGNVTSTFGGNLTWGKSGDQWYIGIDQKLFIIIPDAAVYGG
jgi:hypothetical protein